MSQNEEQTSKKKNGIEDDNSRAGRGGVPTSARLRRSKNGWPGERDRAGRLDGTGPASPRRRGPTRSLRQWDPTRFSSTSFSRVPSPRGARLLICGGRDRGPSPVTLDGLQDPVSACGPSPATSDGLPDSVSASRHPDKLGANSVSARSVFGRPCRVLRRCKDLMMVWDEQAAGGVRAGSSDQAGTDGVLVNKNSPGGKNRTRKWHENTTRRFFVLASEMLSFKYSPRNCARLSRCY